MRRAPAGLPAAGRYALFAGGASALNLLVQAGVFALVPGPAGRWAALAAGTAAGLLLKYVLDALFIFGASLSRIPGEVARLARYAATGAATTALFWGIELSVAALLRVPWAAYAGGAAGLAAGYSLKYVLDRRFVFDSPARPLPRAAAPLLVFLGAAFLYGLTSARSPGWVDATLILHNTQALVLDTWVNAHNLFTLLGHAWLAATPWLDPHRALVLLCALLGSVTVLLVYLAAEEATGSRPAAALAAAALALSHSLWWHSTMVEVYTLNTALIAAMLLCLVRFTRRGGTFHLAAAALAAGLGVSNHVLMGLFAPAFLLLLVILLARRRIGAGAALAAVGAGLAGASLFTALLARALVSGAPAAEVLRGAFGGSFLASMFPAGMAAGERLAWAGNYLLLFLWNFPSAAAVFAAAGVPRLVRGLGAPVAAFYLAGLAAQVAWSANYLIWDMYAFALPVYVMTALPLAFGIGAFLRGGPRRARWFAVATLALPLLLYPTVSRWPWRAATADRYIAFYPEAHRVTGWWDPLEYIFNPVKCRYRDVERIVAAWADVLPRGATFWSDESTIDYPLRFYYRPVRGLRPDVSLQSIFGILMTTEAAGRYAARMHSDLAEGQRVFIATVTGPAHDVLRALSRVEAPAAGIGEGEELPLPGVDLVPLPLGEGLPTIYEVRAAARGP